MSAPGTRGRPGGPRQAPGPRGGGGRRGTGGARSSGRASFAEHAEREPVAANVADDEQPAVAAAPSPAPAGELTGLRLLLDQLDALLRDPTLARALSAFAAKVGAGLRGLAPGALAAARRLAAAIGRLRLRFPRRLLLGLLALTLPLALLALLSSSDDEPARERSPQTAAPATGGSSLGAAGMPALAAAPDKVAPVSLALVLDRTYNGAMRERELRALGTWLSRNHAPGTRVSVIDAVTGRASAPLRPSQLETARVTRRRASTAGAVRSAFERQRGRRLLVTVGSTAPAPGAARSLSVATRRAASPGAGVATRRGRRARVTIDDRRPEALAASVAREVMAISGQRERP